MNRRNIQHSTFNVQHPNRFGPLISLRSRLRSEAMAGRPTSAKATEGRQKLRLDRPRPSPRLAGRGRRREPDARQRVLHPVRA